MNKELVHRMNLKEYVLHKDNMKLTFKNNNLAKLDFYVDECTCVLFERYNVTKTQVCLRAWGIMHNDKMVTPNDIRVGFKNCKLSIAQIIITAGAIIFANSDEFNQMCHEGNFTDNRNENFVDNTADYLWLFKASECIIDKLLFFMPKKLSEYI